MKKIVFGILVSMLMLGSFLASGTGIMNESEKTNSSEFIQIEASIVVESYEILSNDAGDYLSADNFGRLLISGKPNIPSKIYAIAIPPGAEVSDVSYETNNEIVLPGSYNILPCDLPQVIGKEDPVVREKEEQIYLNNYESVYNSDDSYPESIVEFVRPAGFRKYNIADVRVTPFSYKPISGKLTYYPEITVTINYKISEGFNPQEIMADNVDSFEQRASEFIHNYDQTKDWYPTNPSGRETYDYVIITTDSLTSSVTSLVDWEETKGRSVMVVTTSWISSQYSGYDLAEKMRNFLRDKYPSGEWGIKYVCLIGSYDDVPMRLTAQNVGYGRPETDFYHAELSKPDSQSWDSDGDHLYGESSDPIDFYAEVIVGRIPWSDPLVVESICAKSIAYEQNDDQSYKKNILLLGAFFWADTDNAVLMEEKVDQDWMSDWTMTRMYEQGYSSYESDYNLDYNNVKSVWSSGSYAFVNYAGHGSPTSCHIMYSKGSAFVDTDTCNYLNDDYPAIVFADACSNSDTGHDNIGQMMLKQGAVGFLGSTSVAFGKHDWTNPMSGSSQSLDYWFTTGCTEGILTQGESHQTALQNMYQYSLWYYQKLEHFEWGALWGNPDLTMGEITSNNPPNAPTITGPTEGKPGEVIFYTFNSVDPDGEDVRFIIDWGDSKTDTTGYVASGTDKSELHIWTEQGNYLITARAEDISGHISPLSTFVVTIPRNKVITSPVIYQFLERILGHFPLLEKLVL
jgi:hypothetical protein